MSQIKVLPSADKLNESLLDALRTVLDSRSADQLIHVGLSGGSIIQLLVSLLSKLHSSSLFRFRFYFCDERLVPIDDAESTYGQYWNAIQASGLPIQMEQFIKVQEMLTPMEAANDYTNRVLQNVPCSANGIPEFDLLFLGMGPDGHTCSLFPGHALLNDHESLVAAIEDSPKPPPRRVTFTYRLLNNARNAFFIALGKSKQQVIKEIFIEGKDYPAGRVKAKNVVWYLDKEASSLLPEQFVS